MWWENLNRGLRHVYMKVLRIKSPPNAIAMGMGVGVFIGMLPIIPLQAVTVLTLSLVLRCSKLAALIGTLVTNPLTIPIVYLMMLRIGHFLLPETGGRLNPDHWTIGELLQAGWHFYGGILLGGFIMAVPSAILAYCLTLALTRAHQTRRARRMSSSPYKKTPPASQPRNSFPGSPGPGR